MSVFRDQTFVERCYCESPITGACRACGRARCGRHLERGLCQRCTQAIGREVTLRSGMRWTVSAVVGTVFALGTLMAGSITYTIFGLPLAIATGFGLRRFQRRRLIRKMGPALSASKGELAPLPVEPEFPKASAPRFF